MFEVWKREILGQLVRTVERDIACEVIFLVDALVVEIIEAQIDRRLESAGGQRGRRIVDHGRGCMQRSAQSVFDHLPCWISMSDG